MPRLLIAMKGLPRSGKSTIVRLLSAQHCAPVVNEDNIRLALHGLPYVRLAEPMVHAIAKIMIRALFMAGHPIVIFDETNWSREKRDFIREDDYYTTEFYEVNTDAEVCKQRAIATGQPYLLPVIDEMMQRHDPLGEDERRYEHK